MPTGPLMRLEELTAEWVPLDCRTAAEYEIGHLPGALHADLEASLSRASEPGFDPAQGGRHPLPDPATFAAWLGSRGISPDTPVVVYDGARGGNGAARAWWMLRALGHGPVALLEGSLEQAPWTREPPIERPHRTYPPSPWMLPTVNLELVEHARLDPAWKVLDVRSEPRWRGEVEPIDPTPGRIPGSANLFWERNLEADGTFRTPEALQTVYMELLDRTPVDRLIVHCGSGVTACHTLLALERAGLLGARLYVGSYSEWCRNGKPLA